MSFKQPQLMASQCHWLPDADCRQATASHSSCMHIHQRSCRWCSANESNEFPAAQRGNLQIGNGDRCYYTEPMIYSSYLEQQHTTYQNRNRIQSLLWLLLRCFNLLCIEKKGNMRCKIASQWHWRGSPPPNLEGCGWALPEYFENVHLWICTNISVTLHI